MKYKNSSCKIRKKHLFSGINFAAIGKRAALLSLALFLAFSGNCENVFADTEHSDYASGAQMGIVKEVESYGMTPIAGSLIKDGTWSIDVRSSSEFFRIESCDLIVENGQMTAKMTMSTYSYRLIYLGTAEEAAAAPAEDYIEYEDIDDWYVFTFPVESLNHAIDCAAYSKKKKKWYPRQILFDASSLDPEALNGLELPDYDLIDQAVDAYTSGDAASLSSADSGTENSADDPDSDTESTSQVTVSGETVSSANALGGAMDVDDPSYNEPCEVDLEDGEYSVNVDIAGGSGRATISTPTLMIVKDGKAYARLLWSSTYYDWMSVGGQTYTNETTDGGNSTFTIPVSEFDSLIPVVADTTAMGDPVPIQYSLTFYRESIGDKGMIPQEAAKKVILVALIIIVGGFFLNLYVQKRRR